MSEPLTRARRVVAVGAASLAIVLVALAAAAWRLVDAEEASAAVRGRSAAALAAEDLIRALGEQCRPGTRGTIVANLDGTPRFPPHGFEPPPPILDAEAAFLIRESEAWGIDLRRSALRRASASADPGAGLAARAAAVRMEMRAGTGLAKDWTMSIHDWVRFARTRDGVLLGLAMDGATFLREAVFPMPDSAALDVVGSADEADAAAMIVSLLRDGEVAVRHRRAEVVEARDLLAAFRPAAEVDGRYRVSLLVSGDAMAAQRERDAWHLLRVPSAVVQDVARRTLSARGMRLVNADAASLPAAVPIPGDGAWAVAASFSAAESRSRSTLLLAGLGVAAAAAVAAFAVFARSVRREARLAALRTDFVATVSHELRTPVAVVRTSAETLASGRATRDEDKQALTEAIVRESERLSSLVGNVLDFSRMESGRRTYDLRPTDLAALVRDVAARHSGVAVDVAADVPPVTCDRDALGGAIGNLLDNARKYSSPDAPVAVRVARRGGDAVVEVEDHGIGVPDAEKPHVFERFFRGADARVRETRGAGIGLALVQHAASAHGGRVEVADTAGGGATFRIVLPRAQNG